MFWFFEEAFKVRCRRCIGLDSYFLKGVSKSQLLVIVYEDGNNQMVLVVWAVVEVEKTFTWRWFVKLLRNDLELEDGSKLTTISNMEKAFYIKVSLFYKYIIYTCIF